MSWLLIGVQTNVLSLTSHMNPSMSRYSAYCARIHPSQVKTGGNMFELRNMARLATHSVCIYNCLPIFYKQLLVNMDGTPVIVEIVVLCSARLSQGPQRLGGYVESRPIGPVVLASCLVSLSAFFSADVIISLAARPESWIVRTHRDCKTLELDWFYESSSTAFPSNSFSMSDRFTDRLTSKNAERGSVGAVGDDRCRTAGSRLVNRSGVVALCRLPGFKERSQLRTMPEIFLASSGPIQSSNNGESEVSRYISIRLTVVKSFSRHGS